MVATEERPHSTIKVSRGEAKLIRNLCEDSDLSEDEAREIVRSEIRHRRAARLTKWLAKIKARGF